jgi:hypothetical protein
MDVTIAEALDAADRFLEITEQGGKAPAFFSEPL